ncbi:hypothetical protein H2199_005023 [Coniosporium tulheliwenetii]|uniref:Uncharacterized protein n=1 Tax=Coniosporium tulheliwenetii TaxID=3383036 RepID=A0ACC2Z269_9PEZI|nr:hypothetical protein H2199_005023 [Cladosporium sp. JES 115]
MPTTNRPFFSNFLAAFRAHSAIQKTASTTVPSAASTTASTSYPHNSTASASTIAPTPTSAPAATTTTNAPSNPRTITTKAGTPSTGATTVAIQTTGQFQPTRQHSASPYSRSPGSPGSPGFNTPLGGPATRQRRGSDSSSEGFRDAGGPEKWYIGGRTATGEERFYKLGVVKRPRSIDRLSVDRLSL